jgi:hypothetical protein
MSGQWKPFGDEPMEIEKEIHYLQMPPIPAEALEFIVKAQADAMRISGIVPIEMLRSGAVDPREVRGVCETFELTEKELKNFLDNI